MSSVVFVYGTLIRGQRNHRLLADSDFIGAAELEGFAMYDLDYFPGIQPEAGSRVKGELFRVDEWTLSALDRLEGEGYLYVRQEVIVFQDTTPIRALTYVYNKPVDPAKRIPYEEQPYQGLPEL